MKDKDIIILVVAIAATISVLTILYCVLLWFLPRRSDKAYLAAARARSRQEMQARHRTLPTVTSLPSLPSQPNFRPLAEENAYVVGPTDNRQIPRLPGSRNRATLPPNMFLSNDTGQVLRFYTASELRDFPFDEYIAELRHEIELEEARRPPSQAPRRSNHWLLSADRAYPPSYNENNNNEIVITTPAPTSIVIRPPNIVNTPVIDPIIENETDQSNEDQRARGGTIPSSTRQGNRRVCFSVPSVNYVEQPSQTEYSMPPTYAQVVNTTTTDRTNNGDRNNSNIPISTDSEE